MIAKVEPLGVSVAASLGSRRLAALVMVGFATLAMALAGIGLFGALSYSVAQRRRELAIRAALGARRVDIIRLVLREGLVVTLPGIVLGVAGAAAFTRLMQQLLFGVTPNDPITYAIAALALTMVSLAAIVPPAFRAAAADLLRRCRRNQGDPPSDGKELIDRQVVRPLGRWRRTGAGLLHACGIADADQHGRRRLQDRRPEAPDRIRRCGPTFLYDRHRRDGREHTCRQRNGRQQTDRQAGSERRQGGGDRRCDRFDDRRLAPLREFGDVGPLCLLPSPLSASVFGRRLIPL